MLDEQELTTDHWWWRPGWTTGRSFYTWHLTFPPTSPARGLVDLFAPTLAKLPTMGPVPEDGLHITLQGIGFADEVAKSDVDGIVEAARRRLARCAPFVIRIGPPIVDSETIQLPVSKPQGLSEVRDELQQAIASVWGYEGVPEAGTSFRPHLTVAYSAGTAPMQEIRDLLVRDAVDNAEVAVIVSAVSLIELRRDNAQYEWVDLAHAELAG